MKYRLGQVATINGSGESGEIISRAEFHNREPMYELRYKQVTGSMAQKWWDESDITVSAKKR